MTQRDRYIVAFLGGCCLFCSSIEYAIPKPLPFLRLGITNVPIMAAIDLLPFPAVCLVILLKIVGQALVSGTLFSYVAVLSIAGTCLSAMVMFILYKFLYMKRLSSWVGISIAGAVASNAIQLYIASSFFMGNGVWLIFPVFLLTGTITGALLGTLCQRYFESSAFMHHLKNDVEPDVVCHIVESTFLKNSRLPFFVGCVILFLFFIIPYLASHFSFFGLSDVASDSLAMLFVSIVALLSVLISGKKTSVIAYLITIIVITLSNCLVPSGKVLFCIGSFSITECALYGGIKRAATFECLMCISRLLVSPHVNLPGRFGKLLAMSFSCFSHLSSIRVLHQKSSKLTISNLDDILSDAFFGR